MDDDVKVPELEYVGTYEAMLKPPLEVPGPFGTATSFDDQYFRTNPRFEVSDPAYAWLQQGLFVGQGRIIEGPGVQYNVFRVT